MAAKGAFASLVQAVDALPPDSRQDERDRMVEAAWSIVHGFATLVIDGQICKDQPTRAAIDQRATSILSSWIQQVTVSPMRRPTPRGHRRMPL